MRIRAAKVQTRKTTAVKLIAVTSHNIKSSNDMRRYLSFPQKTHLTPEPADCDIKFTSKQEKISLPGVCSVGFEGGEIT